MEGFAKAFPELQNDEALSMLKEDDMKSKVGKERWRNFMMPFEKHIDDYNFGTLIRANCAEDYTEANSIFGALMELCISQRADLPCTSTGYRTQFYAIEIARNRRGLNDVAWEQAQSAAKKE